MAAGSDRSQVPEASDIGQKFLIGFRIMFHGERVVPNRLKRKGVCDGADPELEAGLGSSAC